MLGSRPDSGLLLILLGDLEHGGFDGFKDLEVTRTAAQVAGKRCTDLIAIRMGILIQQGFRGHQDRGRAISALRGTQIGECLLQWMKVTLGSETFHGQHISLVALESEHEARKHGLAVQKNCTRSALSQLAAVLRAGVP